MFLCSGLKINFSKREVLPVNSKHITYLGKKIGRDPSSLYFYNYPPLISKIVGELETWMELPLSLSLFNMVSFAYLLYPLQTIPLLMKHKDIQKINKAGTAFIWRNKKTRLALSKLYLTSSDRGGGANFPNIRVYNISCLLRVGLDWIIQASKYTNCDLESAMVQPCNLSALLHSSLRSTPNHIKQNLLIQDTVIARSETRKN